MEGMTAETLLRRALELLDRLHDIVPEGDDWCPKCDVAVLMDEIEEFLEGVTE